MQHQQHAASWMPTPGSSHGQAFRDLESYLAYLTGPMDACAMAARQTSAALLQSLSNTEARCRQLMASQQAAGSSGVKAIDFGTCAAMISMARAQVCRMVAAYLQQLQSSCQAHLMDAEKQFAQGKEQLQVGISMQLSALDQEIQVWDKRQSTLAQRIRALATDKDEQLKRLESERQRLQAKDVSLKAAAEDNAGWRHTREETPATVLAALERISEDELKVLKTFKKESQRLASELAEAEAASAPLQARRAQALAAQESARMQLNAQTGVVHALSRQAQQLARHLAELEQCRKSATDDALGHVASVLPKLVQLTSEARQQVTRCEAELQNRLYMAPDSDALALLAVTRLYLLVTTVRSHRVQLVQRVLGAKSGERKPVTKKAVKFGSSTEDIDAAAQLAEVEAAATGQVVTDVIALEEQEFQLVRQILQLSEACGLEVDPTITQAGWMWSLNMSTAAAPGLVAVPALHTLPNILGTAGIGSITSMPQQLPVFGSTAQSRRSSISSMAASVPASATPHAQHNVMVLPTDHSKGETDQHDRYSPTYSVPTMAPKAATAGPLPQQPRSAIAQSVRPFPLVVPASSTVYSVSPAGETTTGMQASKSPRTGLSVSSPNFSTRALTRDITFGNQQAHVLAEGVPNCVKHAAAFASNISVPSSGSGKQPTYTEEPAMSLADEIRAAMNSFYPHQQQVGKAAGRAASETGNSGEEQEGRHRRVNQAASTSVPVLTSRNSFTFKESPVSSAAAASKAGSLQHAASDSDHTHLGEKLSMRPPVIILNELFDLNDLFDIACDTSVTGK